MKEVTVTQVVHKIKQLIEGEFRHVIVAGEVTNLSRSHTGHWYFTISDNSSSLSVALFKRDALRNPIINKIKDGERLICSGSVGVYAPRGTFQLITTQIIKSGKGALIEKYEFLKKKLASEGLFDLSCKKSIPSFPHKIVIITAEQGAAVQDFIKVYKRRSWTGHLTVIPALVQGETAPQTIRDSLEKAVSEVEGVDLIVLARGGGSLEDLWTFNDEELARDIFNCPIPVISAIGHETDYTLSDYVADYRAETPSSAAEYITEDQTRVKSRMDRVCSDFQHVIQRIVSNLNIQLDRVHPLRTSTSLAKLISTKARYLESLNIMKNSERLISLSEKKISLDYLSNDLFKASKQMLNNISSNLENWNEKLSTLDPHSVLKRGYSILEKQSGEVIASKKQYDKVSVGSQLAISFYDGKGLVNKNG